MHVSMFKKLPEPGTSLLTLYIDDEPVEEYLVQSWKAPYAAPRTRRATSDVGQDELRPR